MKEAVVIKGNKAGMTVYLEKDLDFEKVLQAIAKKFKATAKFWGAAQMTLTLEGRDLTPEEGVPCCADDHGKFRYRGAVSSRHGRKPDEKM